MPQNHPNVTFRPIKPYHPPLACNTNVASMLHYIRFVFFRPMPFHTPNPLSINANHDFTASSCNVRFVLCPVEGLEGEVYSLLLFLYTTFSNKKFIGTAMAITTIGANHLLTFSQRKRLSKPISMR